MPELFSKYFGRWTISCNCWKKTLLWWHSASIHFSSASLPHKNNYDFIQEPFIRTDKDVGQVLSRFSVSLMQLVSCSFQVLSDTACPSLLWISWHAVRRWSWPAAECASTPSTRASSSHRFTAVVAWMRKSTRRWVVTHLPLFIVQRWKSLVPLPSTLYFVCSKPNFMFMRTSRLCTLHRLVRLFRDT